MGGRSTPDPRQPSGRLPNLILAGVSKAGTTSLFNYLGQHPDVATSDVKELRYFTPLRYGEPLEPLTRYTEHFASSLDTKFAVEATPGYFYGGRALAAGIRDTCPDVRVVVSLRSPVERCWSWYSFVKSRLRIPKSMSFDAYLDRCEELHVAGVDGAKEHQPFWGLGGGCYATWMDDWIEVFGPRLKVLFFEDLSSDPAHLMRSLCDWLEIDEAPVDDFVFPVENKTRQYRSGTLQRVAVLVNRSSERFFRQHPRAKRTLRAAYFALNRESSTAMTPGQRARLEEFYRPHGEKLRGQLAGLGLSTPQTWP